MSDKRSEIYENEKSISIVELIFYVLRKWKPALAAALVIGIAAAGLTCLKSGQREVVPADPLENLSKIEITEEEKEELYGTVQLIEEYEKTLSDYESYMENSVKIKMDPNGYYVGSAGYVISGTDEESVLRAKVYCGSQLISEENLIRMTSALDEEIGPQFLKEILNVQEYENGSKDSEVNKTEQLLAFDIQHYDREECKKILEICREIISEAADKLSQEGVNVRIIEASSELTMTNNYDLISYQSGINEKKADVLSKIKKLKSEMTGSQKKYYEMSKQIEEQEDTAAEEEIVHVKAQIHWKKTIALSVLAAFCVFAFYGASYLFSRRIHTKEELESCINVPVMVLEENHDKKKSNVIDRLIDGVEKRAGIASGQKADMISAMVMQYAIQQGAQKIFFTGSMGTAWFPANAAEQLREMLIQHQIEFRQGASILTDTKAMQEAVDCGYVVFVEKCGQLGEKEAREEVAKAVSCGMKVLGIILEK
ncbi:MAG: hypothetical protein ACI4DV_01555 [Lachnospiraceae bacterium]